MLAGVELGGTKCVCVLGTGPEDIVAQKKIPTTTPTETLLAIREILSTWDHDAIGFASFGPLNLDRASPGYGHIVNTTKPGWDGADIVSLADGRPYGFDTDVNGAALAEGRWGAAHELRSWVYVTVGTGVGVGSIVNGRPIEGLGHSEAGHMRVPRRPGDDFAGICPFHGDCVEGLASGPAIAARTGRPAAALAADDPAWALVADTLAALCHNLVLTSLPQRILMGGGVVMGQPHLLPMVRERLVTSLGSYGAVNLAENYLAQPALGSRAGPLGAIALAQDALIRSVN
ncbi:MAG: ROK family protein [Sphingobium sp.]